MLVITEGATSQALSEVKLALREGIQQRHIDSLLLITHHDFACKSIKLAYELLENYYATGSRTNGYSLGELDPKFGLCSFIITCTESTAMFYQSMYVDRNKVTDIEFQLALLNYICNMKIYVRQQLKRACAYAYLDYIGHKKLGNYLLSLGDNHIITNYIVPYKEARGRLSAVNAAMSFNGFSEADINKQKLIELYSAAYTHYAKEATSSVIRLPLAPEVANGLHTYVSELAPIRAKVLAKLHKALQTNEIVIR